LLRPRVMLGLAYTLESLGALGGTESLNQATKQLEQIIAEFPNTEIARAATDQLDRLKTNQKNGWYAWFAAQEPAIDPLSNGSGLFDNIGNTPADPNVSLPAVPGVGSLIQSDGAETATPIDITAPENETVDPLSDPLGSPAVDEDIETVLPETNGAIGDVLEGTDAGDSGTDFDAFEADAIEADALGTDALESDVEGSAEVEAGDSPGADSAEAGADSETPNGDE